MPLKTRREVLNYVANKCAELIEMGHKDPVELIRVLMVVQAEMRGFPDEHQTERLPPEERFYPHDRDLSLDKSEALQASMKRAREVWEKQQKTQES